MYLYRLFLKTMKEQYFTPDTFWCDMELLFLLAQSNDMIDPGTEDPWGTF